MKKESLKILRSNPLYTSALLLTGNNKLKDFDDVENGVSYRYAQVNTVALKCCPFASEGCKAVCYATKGNHVFPSVIASRQKSYNETLRSDFAEAMTYTLTVELNTKRYKGKVMIVRIHESGDFYSLQYLRKWVKIWEAMENVDGIIFVLYTKSFPFFLMLTDEEKAIVNRLLKSGKLAINFSMDDTTTTEQKQAYLKCVSAFPNANTYYCTEDTDSVEHDNVCDCADCAQCGTCNRGT